MILIWANFNAQSFIHLKLSMQYLELFVYVCTCLQQQWPSNSIINEKTQNVIKWIQAFNPDVGFNEFKGNNFQMAIISEENTPYVFEDFRTYSIIFEGTFGNFCLQCWKLFIIFVDNCYFSTLFAHFFDIILTI